MSDEEKPNRTPGVETDADAAPTLAPVAYERFRAVSEERGRLKNELEAVGARHQAAAEQLAQVRGELAEALAAGQRLRVAAAKGLPLALADRLAGKDEAELAADAERLLMFFKPPTPGVPPPTVGAPAAPLDIERMTPEEIRKHAAELLAQG